VTMPPSIPVPVRMTALVVGLLMLGCVRLPDVGNGPFRLAMVNDETDAIVVQVVDESRGGSFGSRIVPAKSTRLVFEGIQPPERGFTLMVTDATCGSLGSIAIFNANRVVVQLDVEGSLSYGTQDAVEWERLVDAGSAACQ
jgi:hypothetical protein